MTKEEIYDRDILPLLRLVMTICRERGIEAVASFELGDKLACMSAVSPRMPLSYAAFLHLMRLEGMPLDTIAPGLDACVERILQGSIVEVPPATVRES
jgi:hypothetical protein